MDLAKIEFELDLSLVQNLKIICQSDPDTNKARPGSTPALGGAPPFAGMGWSDTCPSRRGGGAAGRGEDMKAEAEVVEHLELSFSDLLFLSSVASVPSWFLPPRESWPNLLSVTGCPKPPAETGSSRSLTKRIAIEFARKNSLIPLCCTF